jgi:hypothetical protein
MADGPVFDTTLPLNDSSGAALPAPPAGSLDDAAEKKHTAAIAAAEKAYLAAVHAADVQFVTDLNAAMDDAMQRRNVEDVKRIDAEMTRAKTDVNSPPPESRSSAPTAPPPVEVNALSPKARPPGTVLFACSVGGSMITKIVAARTEIAERVAALAPETRFNILVSRDSVVLKAFLISTPATPANKQQAVIWFGRLIPQGTTNPTPALNEGLRSHPDILWIVADGANLPTERAMEAPLEKLNGIHHTSVSDVLFFSSNADMEQSTEWKNFEDWLDRNGGTATNIRTNE